MIKSQDILLICIIIILIIVICVCKKNKKEGFIASRLFNEDNLDKVSVELKNEMEEIDNIKSDFDEIIKRNNIKYYVKNKDNTYTITDETNENKIELSSLIDTENLVKLNSKLGSNLNNINYNKHYDEIVKEAVEERIKILNEKILKQKEKEQLEEEALKNKPFKKVKHIDTSIMFNLEKVNDDVNDNSYKVKYINDDYDNDNNDNDNKNNKCDNKCLEFNANKFNDDDNDYYSFEDCIDNKDSQNLKVNNIKLEYKCYDIDTNQKVNKTIKECKNNIKTHLKHDKDSYVKKYNDLLPEALHITKENLNVLPKDFVVITPENQPKNETKQCLTVDNEGLSFQNCDLFEHQRFNYEKDE